MVVGVTN